MATAADIRAARARINETQEQFGNRFGVTRWTIALWEDSGPPLTGPATILLDRVLAELERQKA